MALLTQQEVTELVKALIDSGLDTTGARPALLQFVSKRLVAVIPGGNIPVAQLMIDIGKMNAVERMADGQVPLQIYLQNADLLLSGSEPQQRVIRTMLSLVSRRAGGAPVIDITSLPETKEAIIHTDDMVGFAFMELGVKAALAVAKLQVPSYQNNAARKLPNGDNMVFLGTGWLLTPSLLMTNHHVINARGEGEADASEADFTLQAKGTVVQYDFNSDSVQGSEATAVSLEAFHAGLDYAILRIPDSGRAPLKRAVQAIASAASPVAVNIIQHPGGRSKRYAIRNNLVCAVTATELRYFTDTEGGSSGSPVFNDNWEVVGLHRASAYASNVQFQGKSTAYVNVGTQLGAIMKDVRERYAGLAREIG